MADTTEHDGDGKHVNLTLWIAIGIVLAILFAIVAPFIFSEGSAFLSGLIHAFKLGGKIFLSLLKMMVVPLVVSSVMSGILGLGDVRKLGKPGGYAILYYLTTTVLAVLLGLAVVNVIQPGEGFDIAVADKAKEEVLSERDLPEGDVKNQSDIVENMVTMLFTDNLMKSAVDGDLLPLIIFAIVFSAMLTTMGTRVDNIVRLVDQINHALMKFVLLLMYLAPFGIFCLIAGTFGEASVEGKLVEQIRSISWYIVTVLVGLGLHAFVTIPLIFWIVRRQNPYRFMFQMSKAILTAFSTASSSATLPVTMETAVDSAGVSRQSVEFVTPLGATINMDGTALYEAAAAIFIGTAIGMDLSFSDQIVIAITATLGAIGAAGIPEAGLVTLMVVLAAVGIPVEYVALILGVDPLLDRFRTAVNVFGDAAGAAIIQDTFPSDEEDELAPASVSGSAPQSGEDL